MASKTWTPGKGGPTTHSELRKALEILARKKKGKALIADKFTKDHVFAGHGGDIKKLASMLAQYRSLPYSTLMISSMDAQAKDEVLNWIEKVPDGKLNYANGTWTINTTASAVKAVYPYKFATVDLSALKEMSSDDVVKKSRKWLTESTKTPEVACQFDSDGTPLIYHLDF